MTVARGSGRGLWLPILIAAIALAITTFIVVALSTPAPVSAPAPTAGLSAPMLPTETAAASLGATVAPPSAPAISIKCAPEQGLLPGYLATDPCPSAILAVELAVETVRLPVERIVIVPGPLYCNVVWDGYASPAPICRGPFVIPGQFMHAYASFVGSDKVAVVMLGLDLPIDVTAPSATRPPWNATLVTVEVPPSGWVMP